MTNFDFCVWHSLMICLLWGAWFHCISVADQGGCPRRLKFFDPVDGQRLEGHVFLNLSIEKYTPCEFHCLLESRCLSANIGPSMENNKVTCELNDADHLQHPDDLKDHPGWTYRGTENACSSNPCFNKGTCAKGSSDKTFVCSCPAGYTGEQCERDIDECSRGTHKCSDGAVCNNTKGGYNCTCKLGFEGDGQNCQDIDECTRGTHKCSDDAVCNNTKGGYNCTCKPGFEGNGQNCQVTSCKEVYDRKMSNESKAHPLYMDNQLINVFCLMTAAHDRNGTCGEGGWTLALKTNGSKSTFHYDSDLWINKETFNLAGGETGFDTQQTKLPTYWNTSFSKICLGMKVGQQINFIVIHKQASSLFSLIADGQYRNTSLGRNTWKTLIGSQASLQRNCNKEGFNAFSGKSGNSKARIGILGNNENDCVWGDSRIGFGCGGHPSASNTCGNAATGNSDNGDKDITTMGYILVQ